MTVRLDSEGAAFSDACCFRCAQAGPHWSSRHGRGDLFACRRCFATFADAEPDGVERLAASVTQGPAAVPFVETK